jgi:peptidoglycan/xylan/chitin deacetylase (PgdA/CDA1 family)
VNPSHPGDRLTVSPSAFEAQMALLASEHRVVPLGTAIEELCGEGEGSAFAVTFDDGYRDNYEHALPVLERHGIPATFFLVSDNLGSARSIDRYDGCCDEDASLTADEAKELLRRGHDIGAHGRTHAQLAPLPRGEALEEIVQSRDSLERKLGRRPVLFCYPRGSENEAVRRMVAAAGFTAAVTVYPGANGPRCDRYALSRTEISGEDDLDDFRLKLAGVFDPWHRLAQTMKRTHAGGAS